MQPNSTVLLKDNSRLGSLDGLRAISIGMVIIGHLFNSDQFRAHLPYFEYCDWSDMGVHVFFVISGFLITTILINEENKNQEISLKRFYLRRVLRILPAYYFFVLCVYILSNWYNLKIYTYADTLTFTTGLEVFETHNGWTLGHLWSLGVEEQFYILYPFFLVVVNNRKFRLTVLFSLVILFPILRAYLYHTCFPRFTFSILYRGDCIVWGCLLAMYAKQLKTFFNERIKMLNGLLIAVIVIVLIFKYFSIIHIMGVLTIPFLYTFHSLLAGFLIIRFCILSDRSHSNIIYRCLNSRVMVFIGVLSYSIYLWQGLIIQPHTDEFFWAAFPLNLVYVLVLAWASYNFIEKPFLRLKKVFETK